MAGNTRNNVLIVGGSSGVGLGVAKLALTNLPFSNVIIASANEDKLKKAVEEMKTSATSKSSVIDYVVADMSNADTQYDDVEAMLKAATSKFGSGKIDHVIWTAGRRPASANSNEKNHDDFMDVATTRLLGAITLAKLAPTYITQSDQSSITLTSGVLIYKPMKGRGRMAAAGGGLEAGAKGMAVDLAPIRVNFVVLGIIQTPLVDEFTQGNEQIVKAFADRTLLKRVGTAAEAAEAYLFSMRCAYVTGTRIDL